MTTFLLRNGRSGFVIWTLDVDLHHKLQPQIPEDKNRSDGERRSYRSRIRNSHMLQYSIPIPALLCRGFPFCKNLSLSQMLVPRLEADEILWDGDCGISCEKGLEVSLRPRSPPRLATSKCLHESSLCNSYPFTDRPVSKDGRH